ncbi:MAG: hypothetical protein J6K86_05110 [Clostridia bacterium]|nr:hypothetical protein [Clostridia bacterium]
MKHRIVGWTEYDDFMVETEEASYAATNVVIDEIKKKGYKFSGWAHQELSNGAPVFNDGKKRIFSARTFGGLMAAAHGYNGPMDYSLFAFQFADVKYEKTPPSSEGFTPYSFTPETNLNEEFIVEVSEEVFAKTVETGAFVCEEREELRYIDEGDTLTLRCGEKIYSKKVIDAWAEKDLTEDERMALYMHEEGAEEKWRNAKKKLTVCVEGYKKPVFKGFEK